MGASRPAVAVAYVAALAAFAMAELDSGMAPSLEVGFFVGEAVCSTQCGCWVCVKHDLSVHCFPLALHVHVLQPSK